MSYWLFKSPILSQNKSWMKVAYSRLKGKCSLTYINKNPHPQSMYTGVIQLHILLLHSFLFERSQWLQLITKHVSCDYVIGAPRWRMKVIWVQSYLIPHPTKQICWWCFLFHDCWESFYDCLQPSRYWPSAWKTVMRYKFFKRYLILTYTLATTMLTCICGEGNTIIN
jgi:hypothetical protein